MGCSVCNLFLLVWVYGLLVILFTELGVKLVWYLFYVCE